MSKFWGLVSGGILGVVVGFVIPILLAITVDQAYHWVALITMPIGLIGGSIFGFLYPHVINRKF
jgi:hypothetical protein